MRFVQIAVFAVVAVCGVSAAPSPSKALSMELGGEPKVHQDPDDPVVKRFLAALDKANAFVAQLGHCSVDLASFKLGGFLTSVSLTQGSFRNLSSFVVDDQTILEEGQETDGVSSTTYRYKLWLHMDDLTFKYNYQFHIFGIVPLGHGVLRVSPIMNAFNVLGTLNTTDAGVCRAAIDEALILSIDALRIEFDDETWFDQVIKFSFDLIVNFAYKSLRSPIQSMIERYLNLDVFRKEFSNIYCDAFMH